MQYWHEMLTEESWLLLQEIKKEFDFILIGGWAVYLWARKNKSRDIDIIVDASVLAFLNKNYDLRKNDKMKKYEVKKGTIDIDVYVPYYSNLGIPLDTIRTRQLEGFTVARLEELLILKQIVQAARSQSPKGEKDRIDILSLLTACDVDFIRYKKLLGQFKLEHLRKELVSLIRRFSDYTSLGLNPREFTLKKRMLLEKILE